MIRAYRTELAPTCAQQRQLLRHAGCARWAYNWGLRRHRQAHQAWVAEGRPKKWSGWPNAISLHKELNQLKQTEVPWMYEVSKCAPQEALRNLDRAFKNFLAGRGRYPRFKSKKNGIGSFRLTGAIRASEQAVRLPRIGKVRLKEHGYLPQGDVLSATVEEHAGRWFVSVLVEEPEAVLRPKPELVVGVDVGITRLLTTSDGGEVENPKHLRKSEHLLRIRQKSLSRKKKGSANRRKAAAKVAALHLRIGNQRRDTIHKATSAIAKRASTVVIEDLNVRGMLQNRHLAKAISDASFAEIRRQLEYKCAWYGAELVVVDRFFPSSKRCSHCGHTKERLDLDERIYWCEHCGIFIDRDENAAKNLAASSAATACRHEGHCLAWAGTATVA